MPLSPEHILGQGMESWKLWGFLITTFITAVIGVYKGFQWVKGIRTEDMIEVKKSLENVTAKIIETSAAQVDSTNFQTQSLVRELSELRGIMYGAFGTSQPVMAPARKKSPTRKRKPVTAQLVLDNDD